MMTVDEFSAVLDRLGSDLERWPADLRRNAETLVARDANAAARLDAARKLDAMLRAAIAPEPVDAATIGRILERARNGETAIQRPFRAGSRFLAWVGGGLTACLAAGFIIGQSVPASYGDEQIALLLFSDFGLGAIGGEP